MTLEITYEDGRKSMLKSTIAIGDGRARDAGLRRRRDILAGAAVPAAAGEESRTAGDLVDA